MPQLRAKPTQLWYNAAARLFSFEKNSHFEQSRISKPQSPDVLEAQTCWKPHVLQMLAGLQIPDIPATHICFKCWQGWQLLKPSGHMCCNCWQGWDSRHSCRAHLVQMLAGLPTPEAPWPHVLQLLAGLQIPDIPAAHICCKCWQGCQLLKASGHMWCNC